MPQVPQLDDLVIHARGIDRVEPGRRIVKEHQARHRRDGTSDRDAAPLPARKRRGHAIDVFAEPDESQHFFDARVHLLSRHVRRLVQPIANILGHGQRVEERILLEQHANVAAHVEQFTLVKVIDPPSIDEDAPRIGTQQPKNQLQHERLAGAAAPQQDPHRSVWHLETQMLENHLLVKRERNIVEDDRRGTGSEHRGGARACWAATTGEYSHEYSTRNARTVASRATAS